MLRFENRVVERTAASPLVCRPMFLPDAVSIASIATPKEQLVPQLRRSMRAARLLVGPNGPGEDDPAADERGPFAVERAPRREIGDRVVTPSLVFCLGSYDVFWTITHFGSNDFAMPSTPYLHAPAPEHARDLPGAAGTDEAAAWFIGRVAPLQHAFRRLRELGFTRLAFLSIVPPTLDDAECRGVCADLGVSAVDPLRMRAAFRYKSALMLNALVAEICAAEDVAFLDAWPLLTENGVARPGIFSDRAHLAPAVVDDILLRLVVPAVERSAEREPRPA